MPEGPCIQLLGKMYRVGKGFRGSLLKILKESNDPKPSQNPNISKSWSVLANLNDRIA